VENPGAELNAFSQACKLHSRYNPQAEAARYIDSLKIKENVKYFILIEPGLGYIVPVLREKYADCVILVLHIDDFPAMENIPCIKSAQSNQIQEFLETHAGCANADNTQIIEWRASLNYYKEAYIKLLSQAVDFIKRKDAGSRTTAAFGKRWFKNFFYNLGILNNPLLYRQSDLPVIITGSGPGLEKTLPLIKEAQKYCIIIAASSSAFALSKNGITADIIIATDGGNWALHHMYSCKRTQKTPESKTALAVSLCAALPSQSEDSSFLILNDGSFWQSVILHELSLPSIIVPQRGTVTATAVDLALVLSSSNIYLAGMDFSVNDIRTHVKPYSFDNLFFGRGSRFTPVYSQCFFRSTMMRKGGSMDIYASWFKTQMESWPKRIFNAESAAMQQIKNDNKKEKKDDYFKVCTADFGSLKNKGINALLNALKNSEYAKDIKNELDSLLFSGKNSINSHKLESAIKELIF